MIQPRRSFHSAPARKLGQVAAETITQRPARVIERCVCGRVLARDNPGPLCSPCERAKDDVETAALQAARVKTRVAIRGPSSKIDYDAVTAFARAGLNDKEIGEALGIHPSTVRNHFQRLRRQAREELGIRE